MQARFPLDGGGVAQQTPSPLNYDLPPKSSQYGTLWPTTVYGRFRYLRNVDGQAVKAHRTSDSCIVTVGATKRTSREPSVLWEPHGWPLVPFCSRVSGSPPRAWGRRYHSAHNKAHTRFTPTCVGTALFVCLPGSTASVHPHVRGGRPRRCGRTLRRIRFTPTCVGTALS